jgi:hypothetical protein
MNMDAYEEAFEAGRRDRSRELAPLAEAVTDALLMFKDIEKARELPAFADVQRQYVAMGRQLERLLAMSGLAVRP